MMRSTPPTILSLLLLVAMALPARGDRRPRVPMAQIVETRAFAEPHTPGAEGPEALPASVSVQAILGPHPDLNRIVTVRTRLGREPRARDRSGPRPKVILILVPGFLAGAGTFDPLARQLVSAFGKRLEVWAVDRRANRLEDRRGAFRARMALESAGGDTARMQTALDQAVRFYFDADLDGDGQPEPRLELPDALGRRSSFQRLGQDDLRFTAHWGVDTYVRDWERLVREARRRVGKHGLVLFGGHSMGTTWAGLFAAYDFDPTPVVRAGHRLIDGLLLLEGGGPGPASADAPDRNAYRAEVDAMAAAAGPPVFLEDLFGFIDAIDLGSSGELSGMAGTFLPEAPSVLKATPLFGGFPISFLLGAPMTNRALVGFFLDDDFSTNPAFSASMGFSDNAPNLTNPFSDFLPGDFYVADLSVQDRLRTWKRFDDPSLPSCPPNDPFPQIGDAAVGCALRDNGPPPAPGDARRVWGVEREVTDMDVLLRSLYETANSTEWYFVSGRPSLDLRFGRDSRSLGDDALLAVTQNAQVDVPILAIGASNGLATTPAAFASYLGSVATPPEAQQVVILEGYAHVDVVSASDNEAVPVIVRWMRRLERRQRGEGEDERRHRHHRRRRRGHR